MDKGLQKRLDRLFNLYGMYGEEGYIGERVSQIEHALQCARLAENDGFNEYVILGSFLHDVGHLLGEEKQAVDGADSFQQMIRDNVSYGIGNHEIIGANFLRELNLPEIISNFVENHVSAKRYLVYKDKTYYDRLSDASKQTLVFQGGPMSEVEATNFEKCEMFETFIKFRSYDEQAKNTELNLSSEATKHLQRYREMLSKLME